VRITLRKVVYLGAQEKARAFADRIQLQAVREGGACRIRTNRADLDHGSPVAMPEGGLPDPLSTCSFPRHAVKVENEHGAVRWSDVARAEVSGILRDGARGARRRARRHRGAGTATCTPAGIKGDLKLTNRHGDVTIEDVEGKATLDVQHGDGLGHARGRARRERRARRRDRGERPRRPRRPHPARRGARHGRDRTRVRGDELRTA
jgi:hypothetical protein